MQIARPVHTDRAAALLRAGARAPLASAIGCALGVALALASFLLAPGCGASGGTTALAALAALGPVGGLAVDWARLTGASGRARSAILGLFAASALGALACGAWGGAYEAAVLAPPAALSALAAAIVLAGVVVDRRIGEARLTIVEGRVRSRDRARVVVESDAGLVELSRSHPDLRDARPGAPIAVAGAGRARGGDPFRVERRVELRIVLVAAAGRAALRSRWRARVAGWAAYALALAAGSLALGLAVARGA